MSKRKKTEEFILKWIDKIAPGGENKKLYQDLFKSMNNKEFDDFMKGLRDETVTLSIVVPNESKISKAITLEGNLKLAKELGIDFFTHLHYSGRKDLPDYKTPEKYLVIKLPFRRVSQLLTKKISIPEDAKVIDLTTGAVTGKSQSSKMTYPEIQFLSGMGLDKTLKEVLKYRGGDVGGGNAMNVLLQRQGSVSNEVLERYATGVVSTKTLNSYYLAMHIKSTLLDK